MSHARLTSRTVTRRAALAGSALSAVALARVARAASQPSATPAASPETADLAVEIRAIAERSMRDMDLRAVLLYVAAGEEVIVHEAMGESLAGQPASADMHLRNGAVAITYVTTLLLRLVDAGVVSLDDTVDRWLPTLPDADRVTLRMLGRMTAGYPDYVPNPEFVDAFYANPFKAWTAEELIGFGLATPRVFAPGENWDYSHTNFVILGQALGAATGEPLDRLLREHILNPLGLDGTGSEQTAWMPQPILHAYTSERRQALGIPADVPFYEEATFWNPSWTIAPGAVQYSTVADMARSFAAIGRGDLLSEPSMAELLTQDLLGFGEPLEGCPACHTLDEVYLYGLGVVQSGGWMLQNPLFGGYASTAGYHPAGDIAIGVATTFNPGSFDETGDYRFGKSGQAIFTGIGELLMPEDPPLLG